ncbi:hypothetical protein LZ318_30910 [Saccharopolyspora indica]
MTVEITPPPGYHQTRLRGLWARQGCGGCGGAGEFIVTDDEDPDLRYPQPCECLCEIGPVVEDERDPVRAGSDAVRRHGRRRCCCRTVGRGRGHVVAARSQVVLELLFGEGVGVHGIAPGGAGCRSEQSEPVGGADQPEPGAAARAVLVLPGWGFAAVGGSGCWGGSGRSPMLGFQAVQWVVRWPSSQRTVISQVRSAGSSRRVTLRCSTVYPRFTITVTSAPDPDPDTSWLGEFREFRSGRPVPPEAVMLPRSMVGHLAYRSYFLPAQSLALRREIYAARG